MFANPSVLLRHPLIGAVSAQVVGLCFALLFAVIIPELRLYPLALAGIQGAGAAIASHHLNAPSWWQLIHLVFGPALLLGNRLALPPWIWLLGFSTLYLIFGRTYSSRVPLYLTNRSAGDALAKLLPSSPCFVIDIGCGDGGLLRQLATSRPDSEFVGVEHALLTYAWARLRAQYFPNAHIRRGDFWAQPLTPYDVVYAFLSPTPMCDLWEKARHEMRPGTRLISNSFAIPGLTPSDVIVVGDRRQTELYVYEIPDIDDPVTVRNSEE